MPSAQKILQAMGKDEAEAAYAMLTLGRYMFDLIARDELLLYAMLECLAHNMDKQGCLSARWHTAGGTFTWASERHISDEDDAL